MNGKILGYREYSFTDKDTKRLVEGTSIFVAYPKQGYEGEIAKKVSLSKKRITDNGLDIYVGAPIEIVYDDEGKIESVYNI